MFVFALRRLARVGGHANDILRLLADRARLSARRHLTGANRGDSGRMRAPVAIEMRDLRWPMAAATTPRMQTREIFFRVQALKRLKRHFGRCDECDERDVAAATAAAAAVGVNESSLSARQHVFARHRRCFSECQCRRARIIIDDDDDERDNDANARARQSNDVAPFDVAAAAATAAAEVTAAG